jgi:Reverse transcriptase (RNA-dependent DNA polymerase)
MLLAIVSKMNMELHQMDAVTAFLNGDLSEDVFMEKPEGFVEHGRESQVFKLQKFLYGLKQSPRQWYAKMDRFLCSEVGFHRNEADECILVLNLGGSMTKIALYADDLLIVSASIEKLSEIKRALSEKIEMKDMKEARICLGFELYRCRQERKIAVAQTNTQNRCYCVLTWKARMVLRSIWTHRSTSPKFAIQH